MLMMLKAWLLSDMPLADFNLTPQYVHDIIKNHKEVTFCHDGQRYTYTHHQITNKIQQECPTCCRLRQELYILRHKHKIVPDVKQLLRSFIESEYVETEKRQYSRLQLYDEARVFLRKFNIDLTRELKFFLIHGVVKDTSKQYRRLKLRRVDYGR